MVGWLVGFLTSSSTTRLYRGRAPRQSVWQFYVLPHMRQSWETMTSVSAGHIILTPTQPVGSGRPLRESNPGPPQQESRALPLSYRAPLPHILQSWETMTSVSAGHIILTPTQPVGSVRPLRESNLGPPQQDIADSEMSSYRTVFNFYIV